MQVGGVHTEALALAMHKHAQSSGPKMQVMGSSQQCLEAPFNAAVNVAPRVVRQGAAALAIHVSGHTDRSVGVTGTWVNSLAQRAKLLVEVHFAQRIWS